VNVNSHKQRKKKEKQKLEFENVFFQTFENIMLDKSQ